MLPFPCKANKKAKKSCTIPTKWTMISGQSIDHKFTTVGISS